MKDTIKKCRKKSHILGENMFHVDILLKIWKEFLQLSIKGTHSTIKNKRFEQTFYNKPMSIWEDAQHYYSSGECWLKPQWDTTKHH